jgi:ankyrin repeat protein
LGHSALFCAVIGKHVEICRILLERGFDANETSADFGFTVLHKACFSGSLEICKMLVERGADVSYKDSKDSDALYNAITGAGDLTMCQYLVSKGASREGALHLACFNGKLEVVAWLLDEASNGKSSILVSFTIFTCACWIGTATELSSNSVKIYLHTSS